MYASTFDMKQLIYVAQYLRFVIPVVFYEISNVVCVCTRLEQLYIYIGRI